MHLILRVQLNLEKDGTPEGTRTPDLLLRRQLLYPAELLAHLDGAGDGNRTRVSSLEGWCSTIELHPQVLIAMGFQLSDFNTAFSYCQALKRKKYIFLRNDKNRNKNLWKSIAPLCPPQKGVRLCLKKWEEQWITAQKPERNMGQKWKNTVFYPSCTEPPWGDKKKSRILWRNLQLTIALLMSRILSIHYAPDMRYAYRI